MYTILSVVFFLFFFLFMFNFIVNFVSVIFSVFCCFFLGGGGNISICLLVCNQYQSS